AAGENPWRIFTARAFILAMHPEQFTGCGIDRYHVAPRAGRGVENALYHQRRAFKLVFGPRTQVVGLNAPCDFEIVEVCCVDLTERGVACMPEISAVGRPLSVLRSGLPASRRGCPNRETYQGTHPHRKPREHPHQTSFHTFGWRTSSSL